MPEPHVLFAVDGYELIPERFRPFLRTAGHADPDARPRASVAKPSTQYPPQRSQQILYSDAALVDAVEEDRDWRNGGGWLHEYCFFNLLYRAEFPRGDQPAPLVFYLSALADSRLSHQD
jgi:hypothetical protein